MRIASLDLGSNTFLLLIAEWEMGRLVRIISDEVEVVRLAENLTQTGRIGDAALSRARSCLERFRQQSLAKGVELTLAVTTSAARDATNGAEFLQMGRELGLEIKLLSGEQEAMATLFGVDSLSSEEALRPIVVDIGGGSTEIVAHDPSGRIIGRSIDVGAVRMTEKYLTTHPCLSSELIELERAIGDELDSAKIKDLFGPLLNSPGGSSHELMAVAGTPTSLVTIELGREFSAEEVEGFKLHREQILKWRDRLARMSIVERESLRGMPKGRSDVLVAGATILLKLLETFGASSVRVSTRGVRFGLAPMYARGLL